MLEQHKYFYVFVLLIFLLILIFVVSTCFIILFLSDKCGSHNGGSGDGKGVKNKQQICCFKLKQFIGQHTYLVGMHDRRVSYERQVVPDHRDLHMLALGQAYPEHCRLILRRQTSFFIGFFFKVNVQRLEFVFPERTLTTIVWILFSSVVFLFVYILKMVTKDVTSSKYDFLFCSQSSHTIIVFGGRKQLGGCL